jgi:hypothetical protein
MKPCAIGYIRRDRAPGRTEDYRRDVRAFLRRKHYCEQVRIIEAEGSSGLGELLSAVAQTGAVAVAVPDLSHIDYQLATLGAVVDVWGTSAGQFWEKLKPDQSAAPAPGPRQALGWVTGVVSAMPNDICEELGTR